MASPSRAELEAIEQQQLEWAALQGAEVIEDRPLDAVVARHRDSGPGFNLAARVRWQHDEVTERLEAVEALMRIGERWPSIIVSEGLTEPGDLAEILPSLGWTLAGGELVMFTRHAPVVPHLDPSLRMEAVTPASALESVQLETAVFGLPSATIGERAEALGHGVAEGAVRGFLLRLATEPVATTRLAPSRRSAGARVAGLHGIGVATRHRRRGYGRMITAVATRAGLATGHGLVWLSVDETNVAAVELYRSLGFNTSFAWSRWLAPSR